MLLLVSLVGILQTCSSKIVSSLSQSNHAHPLILRFVIHETIFLEIELEGHYRYIVFNVIKIPSSSMILGFFLAKKSKIRLG